MKAAVVLSKGALPTYVEDFAEPVAQNENEVLIHVKASAVKISTKCGQAENTILYKTKTSLQK